MSEQLHALLLRLYPSEFRRQYGRETLELIRDRWRDERGIALRLRLCMDLATDLLITALRSRWRPRPSISAGSGGASVPSFQVLELRGPRPEAVVAGLLLSSVMVAAFTRMIPLQHGDVLTTLESLVGRRPARFQSSHLSASAPDSVDAAVRHKVIAAVAADLEHYVNPAIARRLADAVLTHERNGDYNAVTSDASVCRTITSAAMASVNEVDALIVDLRDNAGGFGNTAMEIAAYLFDHPVYM